MATSGKKIPWNKGKKLSEKQKELIQLSHRTQKYRKKMSNERLGIKNPMFGRRGELSPFWKGEKVSYTGLHKWVVKMLGRPKNCWFCKKHKKYIDWANKSRTYKRDLSDWVALCRSCHRKLDGFIFNKKVNLEKRIEIK